MKAAIFDLDGTLIDSAGAITDIANQLLAELDLAPLSPEEGRSFIGRGAPKLVERALAARGRPVEAAALAGHVARFQDLYAAAPAAANTPYPGAEASLRALAAEGWRLAICTNKPERPTEIVLRGLGWRDLFDAVVAGDTLAVKKPDPAPLRAAAAALGAARPAATLFIGDSEVDAATARAAGAPFVLHALGYRKTPVEEIGADRVFDDFADLPTLLDGMRD